MDMKKLARLLQLALIGAAVIGVVVFFMAVPMLGQEMAAIYPEYAAAY